MRVLIIYYPHVPGAGHGLLPWLWEFDVIFQGEELKNEFFRQKLFSFPWIIYDSPALRPQSTEWERAGRGHGQGTTIKSAIWQMRRDAKREICGRESKFYCFYWLNFYSPSSCLVIDFGYTDWSVLFFSSSSSSSPGRSLRKHGHKVEELPLEFRPVCRIFAANLIDSCQIVCFDALGVQ